MKRRNNKREINDIKNKHKIQKFKEELFLKEINMVISKSLGEKVRVIL